MENDPRKCKGGLCLTIKGILYACPKHYGQSTRAD